MQIKQFLASFNSRVGLDLGSSQIRIWSNQDGVKLVEPSLIAWDKNNHQVLAVGHQAAEMLDKNLPNIEVVSPIKGSRIIDLDSLKMILQIFLQRVLKSSYFFRPLMMVSVPTQATSAQKQTITELIYGLGASQVYTISQSLAAAIGSGVPIADASGTCLFHLGAEIVEVTMISLGSIVMSESFDRAGRMLDEVLQQKIRADLGLILASSMIRQVKHQISSLAPEITQSMLVAGQDAVNFSPRELTINTQDLSQPLEQWGKSCVALAQKLLSQIPPELTVDVIDKGILLTGGLANLHGMDQYLTTRLGVGVFGVDQPELAVIKGIGVVLENIELFKESLGYRD